MCPNSFWSCTLGKGASNEPFLYHSYETGKGTAHKVAPIPRATIIHMIKNDNGPDLDPKIQTWRHVSEGNNCKINKHKYVLSTCGTQCCRNVTDRNTVTGLLNKTS